MNKNIEKEHIFQIINETLEELNLDIMNEFIAEMNKMNDDTKNNPLCYAILAAAIAQKNSISIIAEVLFKILNEWYRLIN